MRALFDLIVDNIGFIILLLVGGATFIGKLAGQQGKPAGKRPLQPMPSFGGGPAERKQPAPAKNKGWEWESGGEGVTREWQNQDAAASIPVRSASPSGLPVAAVRNERPADGAKVRDASDALKLEPGKEELRRAVLWAEVLGPPRAKRPYRR